MKKWFILIRQGLVALWLLGGTCALHAQIDSAVVEPLTKNRSLFVRAGSIIPSAGIGLLSFPEMKKSVKATGIDDVGNFGFLSLIPVEVGLRYAEWFFLLNLTTILSNEEQFSRSGLFLSGLIERGLWKNRNFRLTLGSGVTYYRYGFSLAQEEEPSRRIDFNQFFQEQYRTSTPVYNQGWALDGFISLMQREKKALSFGSVVRVGYRWGLDRYAWRSDYVQLNGAPRDRLGMVYFQYLVTLSNNR